MYLTYGRANDNAPTYDLVHFKEKIPDSICELNYGHEQSVLHAATTKNVIVENKNWLWIAMGAIILLIGFFSFKMLKKEQE